MADPYDGGGGGDGGGGHDHGSAMDDQDAHAAADRRLGRRRQLPPVRAPTAAAVVARAPMRLSDHRQPPLLCRYRNSWHCLTDVVRKEGFFALYRGLSASYLGGVETAIQFVLYERLKAMRPPSAARSDTALAATTGGHTRTHTHTHCAACTGWGWGSDTGARASVAASVCHGGDVQAGRVNLDVPTRGRPRGGHAHRARTRPSCARTHPHGR
jgi:hypothetical protein